MSGAYGQKADSYEPNNEIGDASGINASQAISSSIFPAQDGDFYKIYIDTPGMLQAQLSSVPKDMKARIDFYGKNYNWITRKDAENPGNSTVLAVDIGSPGWYYFGIVDLNGGSYGSDYSLVVNFEPVVDEEPNNEIGDATEIQVGQKTDGYIFPAGDGDFYKIFLNSSGVLTASLKNVPQSITGSMKGRIDLYAKNMNWVTRMDAEKPGDDVTLVVDIGSPGWYYFGVVDLNGGSYNQTYEFQADFKPVVDKEHNYEIGDSTGIQLGEEVKGFIFPAGDGDFYKIYVDKPGSLQASLESVPKSTKASMKGRIDFYGKNFNWITRKDAEKSGDSVALKVDIANAGWYYFGIVDLNGGSYDTEYVFKVT
jgi:predicted enzyme related to lactoylglutathione lyase